MSKCARKQQSQFHNFTSIESEQGESARRSHCKQNRGKMPSLEGKVAIITGGSSGIGATTSVLFSKLGASLVLVGRNEVNLEETCKKCIEVSGGKLKPLKIVADLAVEENIKMVVEKTVEHFGKIDILVNNAGIVKKGTIETTTLAQYDEVMNINLRSMFYLTHLAVPHLIKTKGNIVNVSSVNGVRSFPGVLSYCISKSGVDQFTRCVALELASKQVRCNSVNPGVVRTEIHTRGGQTQEEYAKFLERCKETHALGRFGEPEEVAATIAHLASDDASFITGVSIPIDGGRHAMCPR